MTRRQGSPLLTRLLRGIGTERADGHFYADTVVDFGGELLVLGQRDGERYFSVELTADHDHSLTAHCRRFVIDPKV